MYLFKNFARSSTKLRFDQTHVLNELEQRGFNRLFVEEAIDWLNGFHQAREQLSGPLLTTDAIRHYAVEEREHIDPKGISFLHYLEQLHILDPITREVVIDRLMAFDIPMASIAKIKWVVFIALSNQPNKEIALSLLQNMVLSDAFDVLH